MLNITTITTREVGNLLLPTTRLPIDEPTIHKGHSWVYCQPRQAVAHQNIKLKASTPQSLPFA